MRINSLRGISRLPERSTERTDPRSTRRAIAFRLSPVTSAASVMVKFRFRCQLSLAYARTTMRMKAAMTAATRSRLILSSNRCRRSSTTVLASIPSVAWDQANPCGPETGILTASVGNPAPPPFASVSASGLPP